MYSDDESIDAEGKFFDEDVYLLLMFFNDRFYSVDINFRNKSNPFELYNKINDLLTEIYGNPSFISRGHSKSIVQMTNWEFRNNSTIKTRFFLELDSISFRYINNKIFNESNK